jgi:hypothetical protein
MTDTAAARYGARQQSQGSNTNTWGDDKLNEVLRLFDRGSKGYQALVMTGDATLSWSNYGAANDGQCAILKLTGSLSAAANLIVPSREWVWELIWNTTGQMVTVKTAAGSGAAIPNGRKVKVFCDGSDCHFAVPNYLGDDISELNTRDIMDKGAVETAIASANLPATAGTVLVSVTDTSAGYLGGKVDVTGSGAATVTPSLTNPGGNEVRTFAVAVGDVGLTDAGVQAATFTATAGNFYVCPAGGTITLPAATGSRRKVGLAVYGAGVATLSGTINGEASFVVEGDQTIIITDSDVTRGWV